MPTFESLPQESLEIPTTPYPPSTTFQVPRHLLLHIFHLHKAGSFLFIADQYFNSIPWKRPRLSPRQNISPLGFIANASSSTTLMQTSKLPRRDWIPKSDLLKSNPPRTRLAPSSPPSTRTSHPHARSSEVARHSRAPIAGLELQLPSDDICTSPALSNCRLAVWCCSF